MTYNKLDIYMNLPFCLLQEELTQCYTKDIPILPEAFLNFASKSSLGPSYAANGPYTPCCEVRALRNTPRILCNTPRTFCNTSRSLRNTPRTLCNTPRTLRNTPRTLRNTPRTLRNTPRSLRNTPRTLPNNYIALVTPNQVLNQMLNC